MDGTLENLLSNLGSNFIGYLPSLLAGIILVLIGWLLGWIAKRVVIQFAVILKLERFLVSFRWGKDFAKADVRFGLYNYLGNIAFFIIFIIFFNDALSTWKLTIFSTVLEKAILYVPKMIISLIIFGFGWMISNVTARSVQKALTREDVPRATLISRFVKSIMLLFFSAVALVELEIAREIVIIGFATIFITMGAFTVVLVAVSGKEFIKILHSSLGDK